MKSKTTFLWFVIAATLAAAIWLLDNFLQPKTPGAKPLFAGLRASQVTSVQVIPGGGREISVVRTNQAWLLEKPLAYPAQVAAIENLLDALQKLTPALSFSPGEMSAHKNADAEFGFDNPQFTLDVSTGDQAWHVLVGNKTAPGDGVYVRVVGATGAYVTDTAWLQFLPRDASDWRDTTLVDVPDTLDWVVITNGAQTIELRRDATNHLWRMLRPLQARANNQRILTAIQQLRMAKVSRFVSDDPKADLTTYGLEPAALDVWLGSGTNLLAAVHAGKDVNGTAGEVFARREGWNTVVTTRKESLAPWRGAINDFRDPNLLELTAPVAEVEVRGANNNNFTLQLRGSNIWSEAGEKFPVDADLVAGLIRTLAGIRIADFVQDVVTASGLQSYGLASPLQQITLRSVAGDTNHIIAQLLFGQTTNKQVYVKRGDENFVYAVPVNGLDLLSVPGDYYRDRHIWNFSETNVALVTLRQNGKTRQLVRNGTNDWSLAAGSQGIINPPAVEETIHQLGGLTSYGWIGRSFRDADIGLTTNSLSMTIELKSGQKCSISFGRQQQVADATTALAVVTLDGERWAFIFPPVLCPSIANYLTIPADTP